MKKLKYIFLIQTLFVVNILVGQNYIPIPLSNAYWRVDAGGHDAHNNCPGCSFPYQYITNGDTVINSIIYTKIKVTGYESCSSNSCYYYVQRGYRGAMRQDTTQKKVYVIFPNTTTEETLFDFSQNVGDTINSVLNYGSLIIESIDSVLIGNNYHRRFNTNDLCSSLIEGIGGTHGLLETLFCSYDVGSVLICMNHNGQTLYDSYLNGTCDMVGVDEKSLENTTVYPNPFINDFEIKLPQKYNNLEFVLYNTNSQLKFKQSFNQADKIKILRNELTTGIYFYQILIDNKILFSGNIIAL